MNRRAVARLRNTLVVLAVWTFTAGVANAGEWETTLDGRQGQVVVENPGPAVRPTVYLVGLPDRTSDPVRKTRGVALNGVRLCETLLSESVLIYYPDGSARWGYHPGFDLFRQPDVRNGQRIDPRSLVEYDKWKYDPLEKVRCVGGDMNLLVLHAGGPTTPAFYEIAFPEAVRIQWLEIRSNCDQLATEGVKVSVRLYADRERSQRLAERSLGRGADLPRFPVRFENLDRSRVYLEISAQAPRGTSVGMYSTLFEAGLDATRLAIPTLAAGTNRWTWTDDTEGSHRARLVLRWGEPPPKRARGPKPPLPEKIANYRSPLSGVTKPVTRPIPPIQEWFPLGVYDGITSRSDQECEWLFDQMKRLSMNTIYISNGSLPGLERVLPLAEARGIRLVYQGGGDGAIYYLHLATAEARRRSLEKVLLPIAGQWIPRFEKRWGLVAWSLTEEISPELSRELKPYYELVRRLDADHPPTVLHNNLAAAKADLELNRPVVVTHDFYPFFWNPLSGPSSPHRSIAMYRSHVASYYKACRAAGASLWMMPQAWGEAETAPLDPPNYGFRSGMRTPEPGEIKLQGWLAIAEGATGLMYYATVARRPGEHQMWDAGWTETANTRAASELFGQVHRVAPLLCRLERDYQEAGFVETDNRQIVAHRFVKRRGYPGDARYVVLASLDGFGPQKYSLMIKSDARVYDMLSRQDVTDRLKDREFSAGDGTLLLIGDKSQFEADCRLIDEELTR